MKYWNAASLSVVIASAVCASCASLPVSDSMLKQLDEYRAPPYPKTELLEGEGYDYKLKQGKPGTVPPRPSLALVCDTRIIIGSHLGRGQMGYLIPRQEDVPNALNVYLQLNWKEIAGMRPWTHWNFVRSLSERDRAELAAEVYAEIQRGMACEWY